MKKYTLCSAFLFASLLTESAFGASASWSDYETPAKRVIVRLTEGVSPDLLSALGLHNIKASRVGGVYSASVAPSDVFATLSYLRSTAGVINAYVDEPVLGKLYTPRDELAAAAGAYGMDRELQRAAILRGRMAPAGHFH